MLQPVETFYPEIADIWVEDMRYPEIAELTCMSLFQYLPYASEKAFEWMADEREYFQLCGFMLMARLLMKGNQLTERSEAEFWIRQWSLYKARSAAPQSSCYCFEEVCRSKQGKWQKGESVVGSINQIR